MGTSETRMLYQRWSNDLSYFLCVAPSRGNSEPKLYLIIKNWIDRLETFLLIAIWELCLLRPISPSQTYSR